MMGFLPIAMKRPALSGRFSFATGGFQNLRVVSLFRSHEAHRMSIAPAAIALVSLAAFGTYKGAIPAPARYPLTIVMPDSIP